MTKDGKNVLVLQVQPVGICWAFVLCLLANVSGGHVGSNLSAQIPYINTKAGFGFHVFPTLYLGFGQCVVEDNPLVPGNRVQKVAFLMWIPALQYFKHYT